jgi:membrane protein
MLARIAADRLPIIAAGVAFYALLAIFPALASMVAIYGLLLDPAQIGLQIQAMTRMVPTQAIELIVEQLHDLTATDRGSLGLGAASALALALWSASVGVRTLIGALNVAYDVREERSFIRRAAVSMILTIGAIAGGIVAIAALVVLPAVLRFLGLDPTLHGLLSYARWPIVAAMVWLGLLVVYRFGPDRRNAQWDWLNTGAAVAIVIWLAGSVLLSWYVENLDNFSSTYGSLGAVVVLLMWFLMSSYAVLLGAEINAELAHGARGRGAASPERQPDAPAREEGAVFRPDSGHEAIGEPRADSPG